MIRSFLLFHFCAKLNQDTQEPIKTLRDSPMENYTIEASLINKLFGQIVNLKRFLSKVSATCRVGSRQTSRFFGDEFLLDHERFHDFG